MWKAAGAAPKSKPGQWLRYQGAQGLAKEITQGANSHLEAGTGFEPYVTIRGGANAGTWMCVELALAYAEFLDPKFWLWVLRTFVQARTGKLAPVASAAQSLAPAQAELAKLLAEAAEARELLEELHARLSQATHHRRPDYHTRGLQRPVRGAAPRADVPLLQRPADHADGAAAEASAHRGCEPLVLRVPRGPAGDVGVCRRCNLDIRRCPEFRQTAEPRFRDYQSRLGQWLIESQGRLPL